MCGWLVELVIATTFWQGPLSPRPKLAVPITVPHHLTRIGIYYSSNQQTKAIGDLVSIAFYFLLRVGEYTHSQSDERRRTQRFRIKDIILRNAAGVILPNCDNAALLSTATHATLKITNQKNGTRGQCISLDCDGTDTSPVKAIVRRILHITHHTKHRKDSQNFPISTFWHDPETPGVIKP